MKKYSVILFIVLNLFFSSVFPFKGAVEQPYDKALKYIKKSQETINQLENDGLLSASQKARIVAFKKVTNSFLGIPEAVPQQAPAPEEKEEKAVVATPQQTVVLNNDQDEQDDEGVVKPQVKPERQSSVKPVVSSTNTIDQKVAPDSKSVVKQESSGDSSVDTANDMVDEYYEANCAYLLADKNNPLIISPFAGAADKAARKTYESAKARLKAAKTVFDSWLAKTTKTAEDFVAVRNTLTGMIANLQQPLAQAKKDNPLFSTSDKDKINRAKYEDLKRNMDIAQAILKELNKKK